MRGPIDPKSDTCTESMEVYAAGISVKVIMSYPGRSVGLFRIAGLLSSRGDRMDWQKSADSIVGSLDRAEGLNMNCRIGA